MGIRVTASARQPCPVILGGGFRFEIRGLLVTICASNRKVPSTQAKRRFVVSAQAECGREKPPQAVALFTTAKVGRGGKLPNMLIGMAVRAVAKFDCVNCCPAF